VEPYMYMEINMLITSMPFIVNDQAYIGASRNEKYRHFGYVNI